MSTKINRLIQNQQSIYSLDDLGIIWGQTKRSDTVQSARDYVKRGSLIRIKRGVYAVAGRNISNLEIANHLYTPSYLSGETALALHGLTFQYTEKVFSMALRNRTIKVGATCYVYRQLKREVLLNTAGIETKDGILMASKERAIADLIYVNKRGYPFEYLDGVDWDNLVEIGKIYANEIVNREIEKMRREHVR